MKKISLIPLIMFVLFLFAACSTPPTEDMERAYDAVTRAENDTNAVAFASNILVLARDALTRMQNEADAKRYDSAKIYAAEAILHAERAITEGKTNTGRAKSEAENMVNSLARPLAETANSLETAWQEEKLRLNLPALTADMETANNTYNNARENLQNERYNETISQCQTVRSLLAGINASLTDEVQAVSRKK